MTYKLASAISFFYSGGFTTVRALNRTKQPRSRVMKRTLSCISIVGMMLALAACNTTQIKLVQVRSDYGYSDGRGPFRSMLIIGVSEQSDERQLLESIFTKTLSSTGIQALSSLEIMSTGTEISEETVGAAIAGKNIDAVLVVRFVRLEEQKLYHGPDPTTYRSERELRRNLWDYYSMTYDYTSDESLHTEDLVAVLESSVYDAETAELIWAVQSHSINPKSLDAEFRSLSELITESLKSAKLI